MEPGRPGLWFGYFSEQAAQRCGSVIYLAESGGEVELTAAVESKEWVRDHYKWTDTVYRGRVVAFVRKGRSGEPWFEALSALWL